MKKEILFSGDCLEVLRKLEDNSVDSVVTDPPYGLSKEPDINEVLTKWLVNEDYEHRGGGFMGKTWDTFVPGPSIWREVFRVLKPGGHAMVFAGTRTQDLMTTSLRLSGFEVRDVIEWLYFSGFPKSYDVSKGFDKRVGVDMQFKEEKRNGGGYSGKDKHIGQLNRPAGVKYTHIPSSQLAKHWRGWGTALKPAHEPIIVVRKPLEGSVCNNVEKHSTGAFNINGCRITFAEGEREFVENRSGKSTNNDVYGSGLGVEKWQAGDGRFPANIITTDSDGFWSKYANVSPAELSKKSSKRDRNSDWKGEQIEGNNIHPTVKPLDVMSWLIRLITPTEGVVLDPFAGSGSTLVAAKRGGFSFIGIEREEEYIKIIEVRTGVEAIK